MRSVTEIIAEAAEWRELAQDAILHVSAGIQRDRLEEKARKMGIGEESSNG